MLRGFVMLARRGQRTQRLFTAPVREIKPPAGSDEIVARDCEVQTPHDALAVDKDRRRGLELARFDEEPG